MAGAGKTSIGKALSLELGYEFLDTDKIIEISLENPRILLIMKVKIDLGL